MPAIDLNLGFYQVAKHYYLPGWHQQSTMFDLMINLDEWNSLTDNPPRKAQIESRVRRQYAARAGRGRGHSVRCPSGALEEEHGVTIHEWDQAILDETRGCLARGEGRIGGRERALRHGVGLAEHLPRETTTAGASSATSTDLAGRAPHASRSMNGGGPVVTTGPFPACGPTSRGEGVFRSRAGRAIAASALRTIRRVPARVAGPGRPAPRVRAPMSAFWLYAGYNPRLHPDRGHPPARPAAAGRDPLAWSGSNRHGHQRHRQDRGLARPGAHAGDHLRRDHPGDEGQRLDPGLAVPLRHPPGASSPMQLHQAAGNWNGTFTAHCSCWPSGSPI